MSILVTGGAGFVGASLVDRLLAAGEDVRILDNLSRDGVDKNVRWLEENRGGRLDLTVADIRDKNAVRDAASGVSHVFHFAAQVAVTTSVDDPTLDFEVNAGGTLNVLEAVRAQRPRPSLLYGSTNKVYGALDDVALKLAGSRYEPEDAAILSSGISESRPLSFQSPYGCSKGAADQYILDYAHTFGVRAVVLRMGCIYGPRQFGKEDQGWVAHFIVRALRGEPITIYGDGRQVRDLLFVDDLVDAFRLAQKKIDQLTGRAFNIGGGPKNTLSLVELVDAIEQRTKRRPRLTHADWRLADQRYYVSDSSAFGRLTGWAPKTSTADGIGRLVDWLAQQPENRARSDAKVALGF